MAWDGMEMGWHGVGMGGDGPTISATAQEPQVGTATRAACDPEPWPFHPRERHLSAVPSVAASRQHSQRAAELPRPGVHDVPSQSKDAPLLQPLRFKFINIKTGHQKEGENTLNTERSSRGSGSPSEHMWHTTKPRVSLEPPTINLQELLPVSAVRPGENALTPFHFQSSFPK